MERPANDCMVWYVGLCNCMHACKRKVLNFYANFIDLIPNEPLFHPILEYCLGPVYVWSVIVWWWTLSEHEDVTNRKAGMHRPLANQSLTLCGDVST